MKILKEDLDIINDVINVAKYLAWHTPQGDEKADEIMDEIHRGKYGRHTGMWVQVEDALLRIAVTHDIKLEE